MATTYTSEFWEAYEGWADDTCDKREIVQHMIADAASGKHLFDLGCGMLRYGSELAGEYVTEYTGIDADPAVDPDIVADFSEPGVIDRIVSDAHLRGHSPLVMSLFATECHLDARQKESLYSRLRSYPLLVAGFYYRGQEHERYVDEGDMVVYQTLLTEPMLPGETRIILPVPSTLFGPDVMEVWRYIPNA